MSSNLMETTPGGESSQYESIKTVTKPHPKQNGQLGNEEIQSEEVSSQDQQQKAEQSKTAEKIRYGQAISEQGFGGKTTEAARFSNQDGLEPATTSAADSEAIKSRQDQGYGPGSGVGA